MGARGGLMIDLNQQDDASDDHEGGQLMPGGAHALQNVSLANSATQPPQVTSNLDSDTMQIAIAYRLRTPHVGAAAEFAGEAGTPLRNGALVNCACCGKPETRKKTLICDLCGQSFHLKCLKLRESQISNIDEWLCGACITVQGKQNWPLGRINSKQESQLAFEVSNGGTFPGQVAGTEGIGGLEISPPQPFSNAMDTRDSSLIFESGTLLGSSHKENFKQQKQGKDEDTETNVTLPNRLPGTNIGDEPKTRMTRLKTICRAKEDVQPGIQICGRGDAMDSVSAGEKNSSYTSSSPLSKELDDDVEDFSKETYLERLSQEHMQKLKDFLSQQGRKLDGDWRVSVKRRGHHEKAFDVLYFSPDKQKFRSKLEVARFLGFLEHRKEDAHALDLASSVGRGRKREMPQGPQSSNEELMKKRKIEPDNSLEQGFCNLEKQLPLQCMDLRVEALGVVNLRPGYYNEHFVWPVGYRCSWHDGVTGAVCVSEVIDGGHAPPIFRVTRRSCNVSDSSKSLKERKSDIDACQVAQAKSETNIKYIYDEDDELSMMKGALANFLDADVSESLASNHEFWESDPVSLENVFRECTDAKNMNQSIDTFPNPESLNPAAISEMKRDEIDDIVVESSSSWGAWRLLAEKVVSGAARMYEQGSFQLGCKHVENSLLAALEFNNSNSLEGPTTGKLHDAQPFLTKLREWLGQDRFGFDIPAVKKYLEAQKTKVEVPRPLPPLGWPICEKVSPDFVGDLLQVWEFLCRFAEILGQKEAPSLEELEEIVVDFPPRDIGTHQKKKVMSTTSRSMAQDGNVLQNANDTIKHASPTIQSQEVLGIKRFAKGKPFSSPGCCSAALAASNIALLKIALSDLQQMVLGSSPDLTVEPKRGKKKEGEGTGSSKKQSSNFVPLNELTWPEIARRYVIGLLTLSTYGENLEVGVPERRKIMRCIQGDGGVLCGALDGVAAIEADALLLATAEKQLTRWLSGAEDKCNSESTARPRVQSKLSAVASAEGTSRKPAWAVVLEPVRKLATNVGARIRNCVREALEMNPPDWAREILEWSISKDIYKGNASGPTKRAVLSVLERVVDEKDIIPPKVENKVQYRAATPAIVMKRCRIILRELVTSDDVRVFCNSLGGTVLGYFEKEDDNIEVPLPLVARPLDFRMIDSRLAACSYGDSHESYAADMRQLFQNIPTVFHDREDLIRIGQEMSQRFEDLYEEKIVKLVSGKEEIGVSTETSQVDSTEFQCKSSTELDEDLKKAPWEEGVCKICGVDKDDDSTLLCDGCDAEYHIYCLEPPLSMIPEGNWYCPTCVAHEQGGSHTCPVVADPSRTIFKHLHRSRLSEDGSIISALVKCMDGKDYWLLSGSERVQLLKFLCDKVLESTFIRDHIDQSMEALPELQQRLRVLMIERQVFAGKGSYRLDEVSGSDDLAGPGYRGSHRRGRADDCKFEAPHMDVPALHALSAAHSQNGLIQSQILVRDNCAQSLPAIDVDTCSFVSNAPVITSGQSASAELPGTDIQSTSGIPQVLKPENQTDKVSTLGTSLDTQPISESQTTPGKTPLETLEAEIEKIEVELMKMAPRRECLGRDGLGRTYWALGWTGKFPWILAEKSSTADSSTHTASCSQMDSTGQSGIQDWAGYNDSECMEQLLKWLKPTIGAERLLKSALTKWNLLWSSKYKKEPDKQQPSRVKCVIPGSVDTKAASVLSKSFGSIPRPEGPVEEASRKRGRKKKSAIDGKIYRCDCLELVWATRLHCPLCHHTYDAIEELEGHNNGVCSWRGFENDNEALIIAKAKKAKNKGQDFQPLDLSLIIKRFTVQTSNRARILQIGCLADKGPRFIPAPPVSPLLDPSLHMGATASPSSILVSHSATSNTLKNTMITTVDAAQFSNGPVRPSNSCSMDNLISSRKIPEDPPSHINEISGNNIIEQDKDVTDSSIQGDAHITNRCHSLLALLPPSQPLLVTNMWAFKKLKVSLLDIEALLSADVLESSRSEPNRRRAWRSFVKSATSILELVQSVTLLEQMVKANFLKDSWLHWTSLSAGFGINTLCSLALRIYSLDAAIKYKKSSIDLDTDDSDKPHKTGRKKKTVVQV